MHDDLWHHASQEETEQAERELEIGPVMPILHDVQRISLEVYCTIEVHLMERFHWNLRFTMVLRPILLAVEVKVMLHRTAWVAGFFILPWRDCRSHVPEGHKDGDAGEGRKEDPGEDASTNLAGEVGRHDANERKEKDIGEVFATC